VVFVWMKMATDAGWYNWQCLSNTKKKTTNILVNFFQFRPWISYAQNVYKHIEENKIKLKILSGNFSMHGGFLIDNVNVIDSLGHISKGAHQVWA